MLCGCLQTTHQFDGKKSICFSSWPTASTDITMIEVKYTVCKMIGYGGNVNKGIRFYIDEHTSWL